MEFKIWTPADGPLDHTWGYNDYVFHWKQNDGYEDEEDDKRVLLFDDNVTSAFSIDAEDGLITNAEYDLAVDPESLEDQKLIRRHLDPESRDRLYRIGESGPLILRRSKFTDFCYYGTRSELYLPMTEDLARAVAYFSDLGIDGGWCRVKPPKGFTGASKFLATPWSPLYPENYPQLFDAIARIEEVRVRGSDDPQEVELAEAVSAGDLELLKAEAGEKMRSPGAGCASGRPPPMMMRSAIPKIYVPREGMTLDEIPTVKNEEVRGNVRTALLFVEGPRPNRQVSLLPGYRNYPFRAHVRGVKEEDVLSQWRETQAQGGGGYEGVFSTWLSDRFVYYFWDNPLNNQCDETSHALLDFPIPLTQSEALWLGRASGLNLPRDACRIRSFDETHDYYRFNFNPVQIETYLDRMKLYDDPDSSGIPEERYQEMVEALESFKPPSDFWERNRWPLLGGAAVGGAIGAYLLHKLRGPGGPTRPNGPPPVDGGDGNRGGPKLVPPSGPSSFQLTSAPEALQTSQASQAMSAVDTAVIGGAAAVATVSIGARLAALWAGAMEVGGGLLQGAGAFIMPVFMIMPPSMIEQNQPPRPMV